MNNALYGLNSPLISTERCGLYAQLNFKQDEAYLIDT